MTSSHIFYSDRDTDSLADILKAVGLAEILCAWLQARGRPTRPILLHEQSNCYRIELPGSLDEDDIIALHVPFSPGQGKLLLKNAKNVGEQREASRTYTTDSKTFQNALSFEVRLQEQPYQQTSAWAEEQRNDHYHAAFSDLPLDLYTCLKQFRATESYNRLWQQWHSEQIESFQTTLRILVELFSQSPNPIAHVIKRWIVLARQNRVTGPALVRRLQLVNPVAGKGGNAPKADALHEGNLKGFWLAEYLKFVGFCVLAIPAWLKESRDQQIYVLHPSSGELSTIQKMGQDMRMAVQRRTATASDVMALLQLTHILAEQVKEVLQDSLPVPFRQQSDTIAADFPLVGSRLEVAYYKNMGSAHALMHLATLHLPSWLRPLKTVAEADLLLAVLKDQLGVIGNLIRCVNEGAEERELLAHYREYLSGHDLHHFLDFCSTYGCVALIRRRHGQFLPLLSRAVLEYLMSQAAYKNWSSIIENEGFEAIAGAIRRATVVAQYWAARKPGYPYEVRYGLGKALLGAANYPEEFLDVLSTFLQSYNAENARIDERMAKHLIPDLPHYRRPSVRKEQGKQFIRLFAEFPPALICKMLVSYGYMRDGQLSEDNIHTVTAEMDTESGQAPIQVFLGEQPRDDVIHTQATEKRDDTGKESSA